MKLLPISYATRNLGRSPGRACLSIGGSILVVLLVLAVAGFVTGMRKSIVSSGSPRNTILVAAGSVLSCVTLCILSTGILMVARASLCSPSGATQRPWLCFLLAARRRASKPYAYTQMGGLAAS